MSQTNSIGDMLGMDFDEVEDELPFDFGEEGEDYDEWTRFDRSLAFDIVWDYLDEYPEEVDDEIVNAILDDSDHQYRLSYEGDERIIGATGIALMAWMDDECEVEVIEE